MVADLSLLAFPAASPVLFPPSKELHGVLPFQGKWPQDGAKGAAAIQLCVPPAPAQQQGQPVQMVMPGHAQAAAFQAIAMPDKAALIDVQDSHTESVRLSLGIAEQCARQEKILKFLMPGSDVKELDESLLAEFTRHQNLAINIGSQPYIADDKLSISEFWFDEPQQYLPEKQLLIPDTLVEFVQSRGSALTIDPNGWVLFTGDGEEMRDLLSVFLEFNMSKREATGCKAAFLVPYFDRIARCLMIRACLDGALAQAAAARQRC